MDEHAARGVANSAGLLLIVIVQYVTMAATGTVRWTDGWLYVNLLFAVCHDVRSAVLQPVLLSDDWQTLSGPLTTCSSSS